MNNKARIFIYAHKNSLCRQSIGENHANKYSETSDLLLDIAHSYLFIVPNADSSEYWATFVFDVCCSVGMCDPRYLDYLTSEQKIEYIRKTYERRTSKIETLPPSCDRIISQICSFIHQDISTHRGSTGDTRNIASGILEFIHVLISIDRKIDEQEEKFFKRIRDGVYSTMGWDQIAPATSVLEEPDNDDSKKRSMDEVLKEIGGLIGLANVKQEVSTLINSLQVQTLRKNAGLSNAEISNHMVFYGNPGTGKTTIARKLGELYYLLGFLSKGHFVETDRSGLIGGYLGQTAIKTNEVLDSALGGILFIDEAYALYQDDQNDPYGRESIDTILKYMEDKRDNIIVIVAGYQDPMGRFLQSNPGLKSRFNKFLSFEDYKSNELAQIFALMAEKSTYSLDEDALAHLAQITEEMVKQKQDNFANGRAVRNLFEKSIANQANRIVRQQTSERSELTRLSKEDILWEDMLAVCK